MIKLPHRSKTHVAENKSCPAGANRTSLMLEAATAAVQMLLLMTKRSCLSLTLEPLVAEELLKRTSVDAEALLKLLPVLSRCR